MSRNTFVTEQPVTLDGYQAVLKPGKYGYQLMTVVDQEMVDQLEDDRVNGINWCLSKLKNPKRGVCKPEPWVEQEEAPGIYKVKFSWNDETKPLVVDSENTPVTDTNVPIFNGSKVKLAFFQKPYILADKVTYGTTLKLKAIQIIALESKAGVDAGDLTPEDVVDMFGKTKGYKADEPNVVPAVAPVEDEDDF
tara:strand:+ start:3732 stop:4310 length:579 start_codon:yes stop_codon:yes gene_type:complete